MGFHKNRMLDTIADINKHETAKTGIEPAFVQAEILRMDFVYREASSKLFNRLLFFVQLCAFLFDPLCPS